MLGRVHGRASPRKLRLFAVACCRQVWRLLTDPRSRAAVEVAERYADGEADERERAAARTAALSAAGRGARQAAWAAYWAASRNAAESVENACVAAGAASAWSAAGAAGEAGGDRASAWDAAAAADNRAQAALLRDLFDDLIRPPALERAWLTPPVVALAQGAYERRDAAALPVLADALEEAGCADAALLAHCRGPGPHVRGCWVVDRLLGRS
jgi:hypothetical protein